MNVMVTYGGNASQYPKEEPMLDTIFAELPRAYVTDTFTTPTSFYFVIDATRRTVVCDREHCSVSDGKTLENVDCVCKTSEALFLRIWQEGYLPGMGDFLKGAIKSTAPHLLPQFLKAFGK